MAVHWGTLVADSAGDIDYNRVRQLVSVVLGIAGGFMLIGAGAVELLKLTAVPSGQIALIGGLLVAPITGGQIAGAVSGAMAARKAKDEPTP